MAEKVLFHPLGAYTKGPGDVEFVFHGKILLDIIEKAAEKSLQKVAEDFVSIAAAIAPIRTGALSESIHIKHAPFVLSDYIVATIATGEGDEGRWYGGAQEFGWRDASGMFHQGRFYMAETLEHIDLYNRFSKYMAEEMK